MNAVLSKKINEWLATIKDEKVRELAKKNAIVTGGAIVSMLLKEEVKDFDVYFRDKATTKAVAEYYLLKWNEAHPDVITDRRPRLIDGDNLNTRSGLMDDASRAEGNSPMHYAKPGQIKIVIPSVGAAAENGDVLAIPHDDAVEAITRADMIPADQMDQIDQTGDPKPVQEPYRPVYLSSNAITLANKIQLVIRFYGEPEEIHKNYDFVHCTNYWTLDKGVTLRPEAMEAILAKELRYVGSLYPVCSVIRMRKFLARGWTVNAGQILKALFQVSELDLKNIVVLEDQLTGVDSAYFNQLIHILQDKQTADPSFQVSSAYISSIIDRIF
jgi:hypothetical protein